MIAAFEQTDPAKAWMLNCDAEWLRGHITDVARQLARLASPTSARLALYQAAGDLRDNDAPPLKAIIAEVAGRHGLTVDDLRGPSRRRHVTWPRQEAMYLAWKGRRHSLPQIGAYLGNRDHTTVLHGVRAHKRRAGL